MFGQISEATFLRRFAAAIDDNAAALFVGAGLSKEAGYADWSELMQQLRQMMDLPPHSDPLRVAQYAILADQGKAALAEIILQEFGLRLEPRAAHLAIADLPIRTIWTTNYDDLIERGFAARSKEIDVKRRSPDLARAPLRGRDAVLYKMHGDYLDPAEIVLSRDDYQMFEHQRAGFLNAFLTHLYEKSFLFVGFSFEDPNLEFLLGKMRTIFANGQREHFCLMRQNSDPRSVQLESQYLKRYRINSVQIPDFARIAPLLHELGEEARERARLNSVFVSGAVFNNSPERDRVVRFCENLVRMLIRQGLTIVSGYGDGIGNWITQAAIDEINRHQRGRFDQLIIRPFPKEHRWGSPEYDNHARRMIEQSGFTIFVHGYNEPQECSGVWREYLLTRETKGRSIPVGALGGKGMDVWSDVSSNLSEHFGTDTGLIQSDLQELNDVTRSDDQLLEGVLRVITKLRASRRRY